MNYLKIYFRDRIKPLAVPLGDEEFRHAIDQFSQEQELGFAEYTTQHGRVAWLNCRRAQVIRFLLEVHHQPKFDVSQLDPSQQDLEKEKDIDAGLEDVIWNVSIWLIGRSESLEIRGVSGIGWTTISSVLDCSEDRDADPFFFVTDGDGEEIAVRTEDIELLVGLEVLRYSNDDQLEAARKEIASV